MLSLCKSSKCCWEQKAQPLWLRGVRAELLVGEVEQWEGTGWGSQPKEEGSSLRPREALASSSRDLHHPTWDAAGSLPGSRPGANTARKQAHVPAHALLGRVGQAAGMAGGRSPGVPGGSAKCGWRSQPGRGRQRPWCWTLCPQQPSLENPPPPTHQGHLPR